MADSMGTKSVEPSVADDWMTELLGAEKTALRAVSDLRLKRLTVQPQVTKKTANAKFDYDIDWIDNQPTAKGGDDWACLSEALYFEARGESIKGQFAVAEVILNRVQSAKFPNSVCGVIKQGTGRKFQCQFTYTCDGHAEKISEPRAYERVSKVAKAILSGDAPRDLTGGATYYHTKAVSPRWSRKFDRVAAIGVHYFYRPPLS